MSSRDPTTPRTRDRSGGGTVDPAEKLEQGRLARPVVADEAHAVADLQPKGDVRQGADRDPALFGAVELPARCHIDQLAAEPARRLTEDRVVELNVIKMNMHGHEITARTPVGDSCGHRPARRVR